jgi:hypothetical protein
MSNDRIRDALRFRPEGGELDERLITALERVLAALQGLRYGTVTAVVQDGVVVQVERTEKVRLDRRAADNGRPRVG